MKRYNIVMLVDEAGENLLMCHRRKPPYQGLYNLVGGKAEPGEDGLAAAYRELQEETGITGQEIVLTRLMDFRYHYCDIELQVYAGALKREVVLREELNPLCWMPLTENFFDSARFAGDGNIGHMLEIVRHDMPQLMTAEAHIAPAQKGEASCDTK